jgi:hypothetical protein
MTTRGYVWGQYVSDDGNTYALRVDADYHAMTDRGWSTPAASGTPVYPRGWTPRKVLGLDELGHPRFAVIADVSAPLWTGASGTFVINASDESEHTCTVIQRRGERYRQRP